MTKSARALSLLLAATGLVLCGCSADVFQPQAYQVGATPAPSNGFASPSPVASMQPQQTSAAPSPSQTPSTPYTGVVANCDESVNLRSEADNSAEKVGSLSKGDTVYIVERNTPKGWHKILVDGEEVYISSAYVDIDSSSPSPSQTPKTSATPKASATRGAGSSPSVTLLDSTMATVANCDDKAQTYTGPSENYSKIVELEKGTRVKLLIKNINGGWHKIEVAGHPAYIEKNYLVIDGETE